MKLAVAGRELLSLTGLNALALAVRIGSGLLLMKVMALALGSSGFALYSQAQNLLMLLTGFTTTGLAAGVTKLTAEREAQGISSWPVWSTAAGGSLLVALPLAAVLLLLEGNIQASLFSAGEHSGLIWAAALALPLCCCASIPLAAMNGLRQSTACILAPMLSNLLAALGSVVLCLHFGLAGAAASIVLVQLLALFANLYFFARMQGGLQARRWLHMEHSLLQPLWGFGIMALLGVLASQGCLLFVRSLLGEQLGWEQAGQWQALQKISEIYLTLATSTLTLYYLPRLSSIQSRSAFKDLLVPAIAWILPCTLIGSGLVYLVREWIIRIAFTAEFGAVSELMHIQLTADVLRITSYLFAMVMWAKQMTRVFVLMELGFALIYGSATFLLVPHLGVAGALWSQVLAYGFYLVASMYVALRLAPWREGREEK